MASSQSPKEATPTIGPKVSVLARSSSARTPSTSVGCKKRPGLGVAAHEARARVGGRDAPRGARAVDAVVVADPGRATRSRSAPGSARRSSARRARPASGRRSRRPRPPSSGGRRSRRARARATITVPSDVQRWPAVPKPPNSAPSTARSRSASSMTTIGFLPPSSRHGVCRWRPHSSPIRAADGGRAGEADLVDQAASRACSSPAKVAARRRAPG